MPWMLVFHQKNIFPSKKSFFLSWHHSWQGKGMKSLVCWVTQIKVLLKRCLKVAPHLQNTRWFFWHIYPLLTQLTLCKWIYQLQFYLIFVAAVMKLLIWYQWLLKYTFYTECYTKINKRIVMKSKLPFLYNPLVADQEHQQLRNRTKHKQCHVACL